MFSNLMTKRKNKTEKMTFLKSKKTNSQGRNSKLYSRKLFDHNEMHLPKVKAESNSNNVIKFQSSISNKLLVN